MRWVWIPVVVLGFPVLALVVSRIYDLPARRFLTKLFRRPASPSCA